MELDLRDRDVDLDGVLRAITAESATTGRYPDGLVISSEQDEALVAEWRRQFDESPGRGEDKLPVPQSLGGKSLWGLPVRVVPRPVAREMSMTATFHEAGPRRATFRLFTEDDGTLWETDTPLPPMTDGDTLTVTVGFVLS